MADTCPLSSPLKRSREEEGGESMLLGGDITADDVASFSSAPSLPVASPPPTKRQRLNDVYVLIRTSFVDELHGEDRDLDQATVVGVYESLQAAEGAMLRDKLAYVRQYLRDSEEAADAKYFHVNEDGIRMRLNEKAVRQDLDELVESYIMCESGLCMVSWVIESHVVVADDVVIISSEDEN